MNNWFDIAILIILVIVFLKGFRKGMIKMLIELAIILLATIFGGKLAVIVLPHLQELTNISDNYAIITSYIISFIAIAIVMSMIGKLFEKVIEIVSLSLINRIIGGVISMGISMVILSIILNGILIIGKNNTFIGPEIKENSFFYDRVQSVLPSITPYIDYSDIQKIIPENIIEQIETINSIGVIDSSYQKQYFKVDSI